MNINKLMDVELVISRYNEDLEWLKYPPFCNYYHTIYNKEITTNTPSISFYTNDKTLNVIPLENIGRESHTYLYHIIKNYNKLSKLTLFLPGSLNQNLNKLNKAKYILKLYETNLKPVTTMIGVYYNKGIAIELNDFKIDYWCSKLKKEVYTNETSIIKPCIIRPFGKWHNIVFGENIVSCIVPYGGVFSVSKEDIIQHSIKRYKTLFKILVNTNSSNPEEGHYFERSWESVFHPLGRDSKIIKSAY
jgi:hypothetical protein